MMLSELIRRLQMLEAEHGNTLSVWADGSEWDWELTNIRIAEAGKGQGYCGKNEELPKRIALS